MDDDNATQDNAITITTVGNQRVKMQHNRMVAIEVRCEYCHHLYWQPVRELGTVRQHGCERMGGASVINKYG